jgi:4-amino-4-deoxy-L-arabinose transferase-like glycosyltransferase
LGVQPEFPIKETQMIVELDARPWYKTGRPLGLLIAIVVLLTIVRLIGLKLSVVDLFYDESQYWAWAQDPAFGYPSKPPLLAWLLTGVHHLCGDDEWCTRSPAPIIYAATSLTIYFLAAGLFDARVGLWAAIVAAFAPGIVFSSRIISTDVPLLLFWAVALLAYVNILKEPQQRWGIILGICLGLGLLSKYAMIYFIPGMLLAALVSPRAREALRQPAMWLALPIAAIVVSPNIAWNLVNSFATIRHTGGLVLGEPFQPSAGRALEFLASQFAVMGPIVFMVMILAIVRWRSISLIDPERIMLAFFIPPVVAVTLFAIYSRAYANWASPSIVAAIVASTAILLRFDRRYWLTVSVAIGMLIQSALLLTDAIATRLPGQIGNVVNPYQRTLGWRDYAERVGKLAATIGAQSIATDDRRSFETLRYYWRGRPEIVVSWRVADEAPYDLAHPLTQSTPEPILFVTGCPDTDRFKGYYSVVEPMGLLDLEDAWALHFPAFRLTKSRGPIGPLQTCKR